MTETNRSNRELAPQTLDFGPDADVPAAADAAFDAWIARVAPALNAPPSAPRGEMWNAIQSARAAARDAQAGLVPGVTPLRRRPWRLLSVIAAALLIGVAFDRMVLRAPVGPGATRRVPPRTVARDDRDPARLYRMAAAQTLTQAEALLTAYRAASGPGAPGSAAGANARQLGSWGREVLTSTRLLMDSPAGRDPQLRALFDDLELVLVQIIQLSGAPLDTAERALIDHALEEHDLLPRIRTAVPAGPMTAAIATE